MIRALMTRFGRSDAGRPGLSARPAMVHGPAGLGEAPMSLDPLINCATRGGIVQQVIGPDGTFYTRCGDGYSCAYATGKPECWKGAPSDPPISAGQVFPTPSQTATTSCASHGGVYAETNPDPYSFHIVCMDGQTFDGGAEQPTTSAAGAPPTPPQMQAGCQLPFTFNAYDGQGCRCMPATGAGTYTPTTGTKSVVTVPGLPPMCVPDTAAGIPVPGVAPTGSGGVSTGFPSAKGGGLLLPNLILTIPPAASTGGPTPGQQAAAAAAGAPAATTGTAGAPAPTMFQKALPYVVGGVVLAAGAIGGKVVWDKYKKAK